MALTLSIQHNIYLNKEDRYALHAGREIETVGVSLPVWHDSGVTSEPAREVFCRYYLDNTGEQIPIKIFEDGYEIVLPNKIYKKNTDINKEENREVTTASTKALLDYIDGGGRCLMYREHNRVKTNGRMLNIIHYVNLAAEETLHVNLFSNLSETSPVASSPNSQDLQK